MIRFLFWLLIGYLLVRSVRRLFSGTDQKPTVKTNPKPRDDDFQDKHSKSIEDADFEDIE